MTRRSGWKTVSVSERAAVAPAESEPVADAQPAELPPLIKGYLRAGAYVGGEPAWDPDFNTADLLMLMPLARVNGRYARHFLKTRH